jgi:hypothetical protein
MAKEVFRKAKVVLLQSEYFYAGAKKFIKISLQQTFFSFARI